jgi:cytidine deaminase
MDEIVFGIVRAVGTRVDESVAVLGVSLNNAGFELINIRVSSLIAEHELTDQDKIDRSDDYAFYLTHMIAGDFLRLFLKRGDSAALLALKEMQRRRAELLDSNPDIKKIAYILHSFCHPAEIQLLRTVFGAAFFLIAAFQSEAHRRAELESRFGDGGKGGEELGRRVQQIIDIDRGLAPSSEVVASPENERYRLNVQHTFHLADLFISCEKSIPTKRGHDKLGQLVEQICSNPFNTPDKYEMGMAYAYQAAVRSASLGRRVGAAITTTAGDLIAIGTNDVPKASGGLYWQSSSEPDSRDHTRYEDSNERIKHEIIEEFLGVMRNILRPENFGDLDAIESLPSQILRDPTIRKTRLFDITEYGRAVHAEMDALTTAARLGRPISDCILYTTTFPCHECARHIIAAGLQRVIYVEPYPKSRVAELHDDAVILVDSGPANAPDDRVRFEPFIGIAPSRHQDLFSWLPRKLGDLGNPDLGGTAKPWQTVPWKLSPSVDVRGTIVGESDPYLEAEVRTLMWRLVDCALEHFEAEVSSVLEVKEATKADATGS